MVVVAVSTTVLVEDTVLVLCLVETEVVVRVTVMGGTG